MACIACLVCFISTVNDCSKKRVNALEGVALVAGTQQNLSNLYSLDIYGFLSMCLLHKLQCPLHVCYSCSTLAFVVAYIDMAVSYAYKMLTLAHVSKQD